MTITIFIPNCARRHKQRAIDAAVLIPVIARPEPTMLFTQRTAHLARHSGQVSFPGGRSEAADLSPVETALRETMEETGIAPAFVSIAGFLPRYRTGTGFDISPVVGVLADGFTLDAQPARSGGDFRGAAGLFPRSRQPAHGDADMGRPRAPLLCLQAGRPHDLGRDRRDPGGFRRAA